MEGISFDQASMPEFGGNDQGYDVFRSPEEQILVKVSSKAQDAQPGAAEIPTDDHLSNECFAHGNVKAIFYVRNAGLPIGSLVVG